MDTCEATLLIPAEDTDFAFAFVQSGFLSYICMLLKQIMFVIFLWKSKWIRSEDWGLGKGPQMPGADRKAYGVPEKGPKWVAR